MNKNILLLNLTRMGDLVQSTPLALGLRKKFPEARITLMVSSDFEEFARRIPEVDELMVMNIRQFDEKSKREGLHWVELYRYFKEEMEKLERLNFDRVINLSHSKLSALMITYLGIPEVRGFHCQENGERKTEHPWMEYFGIEPFNRALNTFNLVDIFTRGGDIDPGGNGVHILTDDSDGESIKSMQEEFGLQSDEILIGVQAGSSIEGRRWPARAFADFINQLNQKLNTRFVLFGVASESPLAQEIMGYVQNKDRILDLTGKTRIQELIAWVQRCQYLVTNDTGTMHIAAAVNTPVVALFFAHAHPYETAPYGSGHLIFQARIPCSPCSYGVHCNDIVCVDKVRPEHLCSMIQNHMENKAWAIPRGMKDLDSMQIYQTRIDNNHLLKLDPLINRPLTPLDYFRTAYRLLWFHTLTKGPGQKKVPGSEYASFLSELARDYDVSALSETIGAILEKKDSFKRMLLQASRGMETTEKMVQKFESKTISSSNMETWVNDITETDKAIEYLGHTVPETKPLADMFCKRKENLEGNDVCLLAKKTNRIYLALKEECQAMIQIMNHTADTLDMRPVSNSTEEARSIKLAVPGK